MDTDKQLCSAEAGPRPGLVSAEFQPANVSLGTGAGSSTSLSRSGIPVPSDWESYHRPHPHGFQRRSHDSDDHSDHTAQIQHQPRLHSESSAIPDTQTQLTSFSGPSSLPGHHASGLYPAAAPPFKTMKPFHRNPNQHSRSHPNLGSPNLQHDSPDSKPQKPHGEQSFSPPFLHPLSVRTNSKSSRTSSPHPASARRHRNGQKSKSRFTVGSTRPNSPSEPEPKRGPLPARPPSPFTIRGFLALPTFTKVVVILFACCVFVLFKAFLGVGHSAESCGVYAHELDADEQAHEWFDGFEEIFACQDDWGFGEYEIARDGDDIEHDGDGYDDEYEYEDF